MTVRVFDDKSREHLGPKGGGEPHFTYLDRSARPEAGRIRELLEEWVRRVSSSERVRLSVGLRSRDDREFLSAFTELYANELLLRLGYRLGAHPRVPSRRRRPDFLAEMASSQFYLEATAVSDSSAEEWASERVQRLVIDALNEHVVSPNFFLHVRVVGVATSPPPGRKLARELSAWLDTLDADALVQLPSAGMAAMPKHTLTARGMRLECVAVPKRPDRRGKAGVRPVGSTFAGVRVSRTYQSIRDAIEKKATRYGPLDKPYVIFVNVDALGLDQEDVFDALLGGSVYRFPLGGGPGTFGRNRDGAWIGPSGAKNTRVSGVLVAGSLDPWSMCARRVILVQNPFARRPLTGRIAELSGWAPSSGQLVPCDGLRAEQQLGLPSGWPFAN